MTLDVNMALKTILMIIHKGVMIANTDYNDYKVSFFYDI